MKEVNTQRIGCRYAAVGPDCSMTSIQFNFRFTQRLKINIRLAHKEFYDTVKVCIINPSDCI